MGLGSPPIVARKLRAIRDADVVTVLNLHRVAPPDGSTYPPLSPRLFDYLLRFVSKHFEVVTFAELTTSGEGQRPRLVLSFDDGYADFALYAAPLLEKYGIRANQNIIPECVESGLPPLNVVVQDFAGRAPMTALSRLEVPGFPPPARMTRQAWAEGLGKFIKYEPMEKQRRLAECILPQMKRVAGFAPTPMMGLADIRRLSGTHEFGAHSYSHASLGLESNDFVRDDVARCKQWFETNLDQPVDIYAFPNGSYRPGQCEIVQDLGVRRVLLVEEDFSVARASVHKRFTFFAHSRAEVRFRAAGAFRRPSSPN